MAMLLNFGRIGAAPFMNLPGQLSLLPSVGREMSTGQSAVMLCGL